MPRRWLSCAVLTCSSSAPTRRPQTNRIVLFMNSPCADLRSCAGHVSRGPAIGLYGQASRTIPPRCKARRRPPNRLPSAGSLRRIAGRKPRRTTMRRFLGRPLLGIAAALLAFGVLAQQPLRAADLDSLAKRVQVLEDREAIRALILAYGQAHDHRDYKT